MKFEETPYSSIRILLFFVSGILCYIYFSWKADFLIYIFGGLITLYFFLFLTLSKVQSRIYSLLFGGIGSIIIFLFGILLTGFQTQQNDNKHISHHKNNFAFYEAIVCGDIKLKKNTKKTTVNIIRLKTGDVWYPATGKIVLYISNEDSTLIEYGDKLLIKGMPLEVPPPANPNEFNYKRYQSFQNIHFQQYIKKRSFLVIKNVFREKNTLYSFEGNVNFLIANAIKARKWCATIFQKYISSPQEYAVAVALVLGIKDEINNDLKSAYSSAGAMHILAVSGLHVGIIIHLLIFLLGKLQSNKRTKLLYAFIVIFGIWGFAFITGLSASVLRAVIMYTFFIFGKAFNKSTSIYNILATTAIVLLSFQPYMIMEVGFQLSFVAVLGIVYLQPKIFNLIKKEPILESEKTPTLGTILKKGGNYLLLHIWEITTVSIAAQIATFPIGLFYFHQFPVYFWFSNLFVIFLALIIVYSGVGLIVFSVFPFIASFTGCVIQTLINLLNIAVFEVQRLPYSLIQGIDISIFETWLLYGGIISLTFLYVYKKYAYVVIAFGLTSIFISMQIIEHYVHIHQKSMIIYKINNHTGFNFIDGLQSTIIGNSSFINDPDKIKFHVNQNLWNKGVYNSKLISFSDLPLDARYTFAQRSKGQVLMVWKGKSILNIRKPIDNLTLKVNYLVLSNNAIKNLDNINNVVFEHLVIDASNSNYISNNLMLQAESLDIKVISLRNSGAYVVEF